MEEFMEFKITEAEAREMARFEEAVGCDISAGPDWGVHFDKVVELVLNQGDNQKSIDPFIQQFGSVLSSKELEKVATSFQTQIQERLEGEIARRQST
jgi:hypothetical protein